MSIDWFRSWHGAPTDPKWLSVARRAEVGVDRVICIVWCLMDYASQNAERGSIDGVDVEALSDFTAIPEEDILRVIDVLRDKHIVNSDGNRFSAWEKRQPKREDNSTERTRRYRERNVTQRDAKERQRRGEKSREDKKEKETPHSVLKTLLDEEGAKEVIEHRQRLRAPLTVRAAKLLVGNLSKFSDPNAAADKMILRGWKSIEPGWGATGPQGDKPYKPTGPKRTWAEIQQERKG